MTTIPRPSITFAPDGARELNPHSRNLVADDQNVAILELSEDAPVSEVRIHREHERGVPNQIATSANGRDRLARVENSTIARRHDGDNQAQAYPDVRVSHVRIPSVMQPHPRQTMPASVIGHRFACPRVLFEV
jgi:hypothetical protein